jgi:TRAP-type C4-dicarboxylate transport system substrate-binding protein
MKSRFSGKYLGAALAVTALALTAACGSPVSDASAGGPHEWKYASYGPPSQFDTLAMKAWEQDMNDRLDGVSIKYYNSEALFKAADTLASVGSGVADFAFIAPGYTPKEMPLSQVFGLPFQGTDSEAAARAVMDVYTSFEPFQEEWRRHNVHLLNAIPLAPAIIVSPKPIARVEDLKGKKVRATGYLLDAFTQVGAQSVAITQPEVYEALQRGVLDASSSTTLDVAVDHSFQEVAPYFVDPGTGVYGLVATAMNLDVWNSLTDAERQTIQDYSDEWMAKAVKIVMDKEAASCDVFLKSGGDLHALPEDEVKRWAQDAGPAITNKWVSDTEALGAPAREFLDAYLAAYEKNHANSTYVPGIQACLKRAEG